MATETISQAEVAQEAGQGQPEAKTSLLGAEATKATAKQPVDGDAEIVGADSAEDAPEPKKDEGKKPDGDADEAIPEDFEFKLPEGEEASGEVLSAFRDVARELEMPKGKAQALLSKMLPVMREQQQAKIAAQFKTWADETAKDKEIGGSKLEESVKSAREGIRHYFGDSFIDWLEQSGGGNRKDVILGFAKLGRDLRSDAFVQGAARRGQVVDMNDPQSVARKLFPNES